MDLREHRDPVERLELLDLLGLQEHRFVQQHLNELVDQTHGPFCPQCDAVLLLLCVCRATLVQMEFLEPKDLLSVHHQPSQILGSSFVSLKTQTLLFLFFVPYRVLLVLLELPDSPAPVAHLDHRELQDLWGQRDSL